jgi:hypothetical protein
LQQLHQTMNKLTTPLTSRLTDALPDEPVDVVFELNTNANESAAEAGVTRAEKIAAMKASFAQDLEEVEQTIRNLGGEITGKAWINGSIRATIPAGGVDRVAELDRVRIADVPHAIERE